MSSGRKQRVLGSFLVAAGLLMVLATGAYYANGLLARSTLDELEVESERPSARTLEPQPGQAPAIEAVVPAHTKIAEGPPTDSVEAVQAETHNTKPEPQVTATTVTESKDVSPPTSNASDSNGLGKVSTAPGTVVTKTAPQPTVTQSATEPVVIHKVNAEPVVVRVAAEIIRVQHVDPAPPSRAERSAASSQWDWRGRRDTSNPGQFSDDEIGKIGPAIAYTSPVEKPAPDQESPAASQAQPSTDTPTSGETVTESVATTNTDTSTNGENGTEAVTTANTDGSGNDENGSESVSTTNNGSTDSSQPVAETVTLTPAETGEALLTSYHSPDASISYDTSAASRMHIPAIGVESGVRDLRVIFNGQSAAWETPDNIVGHIPTTARPGAAGQGWYFGHLDSPVRGEGNVFRYLPKIPDLTKSGPIYIFLETASHSYAYQVYKTEVVHQSRLEVSDSGQQDITLVTCVPRFYYDHRLLVTAALVGVKPSEPQSG